MAKFFVQVLLVKEIAVEANDELQAERAAYAKLGRDKDNAIGLKVFDVDGVLTPDLRYDPGALTDDNIKNMEYVRKHFHTLDVAWCSDEAV